MEVVLVNKLGNINILDCTLRDGGHVNDANFGADTIKNIVELLSKSGVEIVELGFLKNGDFSKDEANFNRIEEVYEYLPNEQNCEYSLMIRPDWYDISSLSLCNGKINFLRFAFYYKDIELTKKYCKIARDLGYKFFLNPVNLPGYEQKKLKKLIEEVNVIKPEVLTIVDTFGSLTEKSLVDIYEYVEANLDNDIAIDLHLHENLNLSFSLAQHFLKIKKNERKIFMDASLFGMGRIPGNLCVETIMDFLNSEYGKVYNLSPILYAISKHISPLKDKYHWGYSPAYYYTGKLCIHRSYAEFLLDKKTLSLDTIREILYRIKEEDGDSAFFNKKLVESLYDKAPKGDKSHV